MIYQGRAQVNTLACEVTHEATGEAVARACGIENVIKEVAGDHEMAVTTPQNRAVFAALDHKSAGAHGEDLLGGLLEVGFAGEQAGFTVIDEEEVPARDGLDEFVTETGDPVVHGVATGNPQIRTHLFANRALQARLDVAEQEVGALLVGGRELRVEVGEDVEVCDQRFAIIHVLGVLAGPEEALAGDSFQTFQIDAARKEQVGVFLREIVADDSNNRGLREK